MIGRTTKLQLLVFAVVALLGLTCTGARYADLGHLMPGYDEGYRVSAVFEDSGGAVEHGFGRTRSESDGERGE